MKSEKTLTVALFASCVLALTAFAGPESLPSSGKEMKEVAPAPLPECNWTGFYFGLNAGGQFGHSEDTDLSDYWYPHYKWGYSESGAVAGGQIGYNYQWRWLVVGPEFDLGYMNLDGHGIEGNSDSSHNVPPSGGGPNVGSSSSDLFTTLRGRVGVNLDWHGCWLVYGTGGAIGINYETRSDDRPEDLHGHTTDFAWGYTVGGGIERQIGRHWSVKVDYLYFNVEGDQFTGLWPQSAPFPDGNTTYKFRGETFGNIVRAGLNFRF